jgi:hypothetical protein
LACLQPRRALLAAGRYLNPGHLSRLRIALGALEQGSWMTSLGARVPNDPDRYALFTRVCDHLTAAAAPLYVEFGVYRGRTLGWWSRHLATPGARFVGFDSFRGLPRDWTPDTPGGAFTVEEPPCLPDPRVSLVPGWFEDTLPNWQPPAHDRLIVNIDCDLYSSTVEALRWVERHARVGTMVYFDDLFDHDHELRALWEWMDRCPLTLVPLRMARWGQHLLIECR